MLFKQVSEIFKQHRDNGDFKSAAEVMRGWAEESGKPHYLWHANIVLLLLAINMALPDDIAQCIEQLEGLDVHNPYLLSLICQVRLSEDKYDEAIIYAARAVENAKAREDPGLEVYQRDLVELAKSRT